MAPGSPPPYENETSKSSSSFATGGSTNATSTLPHQQNQGSLNSNSNSVTRSKFTRRQFEGRERLKVDVNDTADDNGDVDLEKSAESSPLLVRDRLGGYEMSSSNKDDDSDNNDTVSV
jgi:hypothetical protein